MKKNRLYLILAFFLSFATGVFAQGGTFKGEIMDAPCAAMGSHEHMMKAENAKNARDCTLACVKTHGGLVLYDAASKKVYKLDDQAKAKVFAGQRVTVTGVYDKAVKTIHIRGIGAALRSQAAVSDRPSKVHGSSDPATEKNNKPISSKRTPNGD